MGVSMPNELHIKSKSRKAIAGLALMLTLTGCISPWADSKGQYTKPIGNAPVVRNETPYSDALACIARHADAGRVTPPRIAVGNIRDYTGKQEADGTGLKITQGAALMAISALAKAGVPLVERFDTSVSELELKYANNKLIGDDKGEEAYRKIYAGSIPGSDFYLVGGITELNFNIRSAGVDGFFADPDPMATKANLTAKLFVLDIGLDLRLVRTSTLEVVDVVSYRKQILGREIRAGIFDFFGGNLFDIGVGERALEPIQLAVRSAIERAVLEMVAGVYGIGPGVCSSAFGVAGDPLAGPGDNLALQRNRVRHTDKVIEPNLRPTNSRREAIHNDYRKEPYAWYSGRDDRIPSGFRGRMD
jgi:curli production assembly/transport component CsgG/holdfast attachment protein HfaB